MLILDGKQVAQAVKSQVASAALEFEKKVGRRPGLGVIIVGDDPASHVYVRNKELACATVNFYSEKMDLPENATEAELLKGIEAMNKNQLVDAFLVQMPLPKHLSSDKALDAIDPMKDADGLHPVNLGYLWANRKRVAPCTPWGVMKILEHYKIPIKGKNCVVVGRSQIVGRPMAHLLTMADGTVTVCHSRTANMSEITRHADIVIVAAGQRHLLGREDFKQGAVVVDVGIHGSGQGKGVTGDVRFQELEGWVSAVTPVPGGVGPMTIACLLENTLTLAQLRADHLK
ncbi:MAG: methylenetetrahydrofolate dehydrogenase / methenyltetrahydrofolate cyclohydrolase [Pseudomonadota bacterium]|jgi:methylenetetrahydrofolate dehydrogenase (NADP+)/methenyltetrahydrofolate cyclohydrolase